MATGRSSAWSRRIASPRANGQRAPRAGGRPPRRVTLLTSPLAIVEAERNLEAKRPSALPALRRSLSAVRIVSEPPPADVERLTPPELSSKDRPLLAAAIIARAPPFVT